MSNERLGSPVDRLNRLEDRVYRVKADVLDLEEEVRALRGELSAKPSAERVVARPKSGERLVTVREFAERYLAFTESSLRWIRYRSQPVMRVRRGGRREVVPECETNGFETAFIKIGRRVLIDEREFFRCVEQNRGK